MNTLPIITFNGTSAAALVEYNSNIVSAIANALETIERAEFHPRDYASAEHWQAALAEHRQHVAALHAAEKYFSSIVEHAFNHGGAQ